MTDETKKELKKYKDWLNENHVGMYCKITDYFLDKYIKEQLTIPNVSNSFCERCKKKHYTLIDEVWTFTCTCERV